MKTILFFIILGFSFNLSVAQQPKVITLPSPKIGWDSLEATIVYPELHRRAGLWGAYEAKLKIDSLGRVVTMTSTNANSYEIPNMVDSMFINFIKYSLAKIEWNPGMVNHRPATMDLTIPFVFYFTNRPDVGRNIFIKRDPAKISITR